MCLIIHRQINGKHGSNVPNEVLDYNRKKNSDGFGIAWREDGTLRHMKFGPQEYDEFHALLKTIDKDTTTEYVAHYRMATHGAPCRELSHPFVYEDKKVGDVAIFHNGIIPIKPSKGESDTSEFVKKILMKMTPRWWKTGHGKWLVEQSMGWSRLLVMTNTETIRLAADDWKEHSGIWYSIDPFPPKYSTSPYTYGANSYSGKGYTPPAAWTDGVEDEDDGYESSFASKYGEPVPASGWKDKGHWVIPVSEVEDVNGDVAGEVECINCGGMGDYYRIEGNFFFDVDHLENFDDEPELSKPQQQLLLPAPTSNMPLVTATLES